MSEDGDPLLCGEAPKELDQDGNGLAPVPMGEPLVTKALLPALCVDGRVEHSVPTEGVEGDFVVGRKPTEARLTCVGAAHIARSSDRFVAHLPLRRLHMMHIPASDQPFVSQDATHGSQNHVRHVLAPTVGDEREAAARRSPPPLVRSFPAHGHTAECPQPRLDIVNAHWRPPAVVVPARTRPITSSTTASTGRRASTSIAPNAA